MKDMTVASGGMPVTLGRSRWIGGRAHNAVAWLER